MSGGTEHGWSVRCSPLKPDHLLALSFSTRPASTTRPPGRRSPQLRRTGPADRRVRLAGPHHHLRLRRQLQSQRHRLPDANGLTATYSHDAADGLTGIADSAKVGGVQTPFWSYGYTLDGLGQVAAVNDPVQPGAVQHTYGRNALDQLTADARSGTGSGEHQLGLRQRLPHQHAGGQRGGQRRHVRRRRGGPADRAGEEGGHHHHPEPHPDLQRRRGADRPE